MVTIKDLNKKELIKIVRDITNTASLLGNVSVNTLLNGTTIYKYSLTDINKLYDSADFIKKIIKEDLSFI